MAIHAFTTSGLRRAVIASAHLVSEAAPAVLGAGLFLLSVVTLIQPENLHGPAQAGHHHTHSSLLLASAKAERGAFMMNDQSKARMAIVAGLGRLAGLAAMTGTDAITADSLSFCPPPVDSHLVGLCADLAATERERQRQLDQAHSLPASRLGGLLARRQTLIAAVCETKAGSLDGLKAKSRATRLVLGDAVVPRNMREALMRSLLEDMQGGLL